MWEMIDVVVVVVVVVVDDDDRWVINESGMSKWQEKKIGCKKKLSNNRNIPSNQRQESHTL